MRVLLFILVGFYKFRKLDSVRAPGMMDYKSQLGLGNSKVGCLLCWSLLSSLRL